MSHHSSRKRRSGTAASRKPRPAKSSTSAGSARSTATSDASSSERRHARREAAIRRERQKKQLRLIIGGVVVAVVAVVALIVLNRPTETAADVDYDGIAIAQPPIAQASGTPPSDPVSGPTGSYTGTVIGDPDAPVTFIVYSDFRCHFCQQFHAETYPKIVDDFVRTGEVKIELRDFPALGGADLRDGENTSARAAEAAMCAAEQDAYVPYHATLFENFSADGSTYSADQLVEYADEIDLDTGAFEACMASDRYIPALQESLDEGRALGITATPMFIIENGSGEPNVVQQTSAGYDLLKKQIQAAIDTAQGQ